MKGTAPDGRIDEKVVIWSGEHFAYWMPNERGYHDNPCRAGRYTRAVAERIAKGCGPEKMIEIRPAPACDHAQTCQAAPSLPATRADVEAATFWLIERSQPEQQNPPCWWDGKTHCYDWVFDARKAKRFASKAGAEAAFCPTCIERGSGHATEHVFLSALLSPPVADAMPQVRGEDVREVRSWLQNTGFKENKPIYARILALCEYALAHQNGGAEAAKPLDWNAPMTAQIPHNSDARAHPSPSTEGGT